MFEVGKLEDERLDNFLVELDKVDHTTGEGETRRYFEHSVTLRNTIRFLKNYCKGDGRIHGVDLIRAERLNSIPHKSKVKILRRNYEILVSMAPLTCEDLTITSSIPRHFGPVIPEINSVWFKLYFYNLLGAGPDSIFYPMGLRVTNIPEVFKHCEHLWLKNYQSELQTIHISQFLSSVNDALTKSPVLVQAQSYRNKESVLIPVSFPLGEDTGEILDERDYNEQNIKNHPLVKALAKELDLYNCCGYIHMHLIDNPYTNVYMWVPFEVVYGVPLFDISINTETCNKIEKYSLFSNDNLTDFSKTSRMLAVKLLDFISNSNEGEYPIENVEGIQHPRNTIIFTSKNKSYSEKNV